ncbi:PAS domain-containing protein [uncultured Rhodospira sp.]|uniref:PAS domain-containing protein n=1 Tax=uncultured Rhodospira sp. TaxID=1936189 RepID=UPI00261F62B7|nr:PAS domain-containing protein [uncultured Rhodospira sp.]
MVDRQTPPTGTDKTAADARTDRAFWQSATLLSAALEATGDMVSVKDEHLVIRFANTAMARVIGRPVGDLVGKADKDLFPAEVAEALRNDDRAVLDTGRTLIRDLLLPTNDGLVWVSARKDPVTDQGRRIGVMTVLRDISDRIEAERRLRHSTNLLDRIFTQSVFAVAYLDRRFNVRRVNQAYAHRVGRQPDDLVGHNHFALFPSREDEAVFRTVLRTGKPYTATARPLAAPDGSDEGMTFWDVSIQPVRDVAGVIDGLLVGLVDVTDHQRTLQALRQSERDKALILGSISDLVAFFEHSDMRIAWTNAAAARSVNAEAHALIGHHCYTLWGHRDTPCEGCPVLRCFETGTACEQEQVAPDGRTWSVRAFPALDEDGTLKGVVEVARDVTAQRRFDVAVRRSLANLDAYFALSRDLLAVLDMDGCILEANQTLLDTLGWSRDDLIGQSMLVLRPEDQREAADSDLRDILAGLVDVVTMPVVTRDGRVVPAETRIALGTWNHAPAFFTATRDLSELALSKEKFEKAFTTNATLMAITDPETGRLVDANESLLQTLGRTRAEVIGKTTVELDLFPSTEARLAMVEALLAPDDPKPVEYRFIRPDGRLFIGELTGELITSGSTRYLLTMLVDVTEQRALMAELEHKATHDVLTGAFNRQQAIRGLDQETRRADRMETPAAVIMADIDHFKAINDTHGHPVGDQVLREVVTRLSDRIRETDLLARWGGEEFLVILPGTDTEGARQLAETLREAMASVPMPPAGTVTLSLGIAQHRPGESVEDWVARADEALYRAKADGRDCVRCL